MFIVNFLSLFLNIHCSIKATSSPFNCSHNNDDSRAMKSSAECEQFFNMVLILLFLSKWLSQLVELDNTTCVALSNTDVKINHATISLD